MYVEISGTSKTERVAIPARNKREAEQQCNNLQIGVPFKIEDVSSGYEISIAQVAGALARSNFSDIEIDFICRTLQITGIAN